MVPLHTVLSERTSVRQRCAESDAERVTRAVRLLMTGSRHGGREQTLVVVLGMVSGSSFQNHTHATDTSHIKSHAVPQLKEHH
jgi:phage-related minor tail protein